jgi:nicotinamide riboside kinase
MSKKPELSKFSFIGAQSAGKTTLTNICKKIFANNPKVAVLDEAARIFFKTNPEITDRSFKTQLAIQNLVLAREKAANKPGVELIIQDRSVIDPIVLAQIWDQDNAHKLFENVKDWLQTYTLFFILDLVGVPSQSGPYRQETQEQRKQIQQAFIDFCKINKLPHKVISGTLDQRVEQTAQIINKSLN